MKEILNKLNLNVIDTYGLKFDFKEYEVVDFSEVDRHDIFYKNKWSLITAENNLLEILEKGYGVFYDDKVYYSVNLAPEIINKEKKNLESYISNKISLRKMDRYNIQKYLISPEYEILVRNMIMFYDKNFDIEFIRKRLHGKVKDVDKFIQYLTSKEYKSAI